MKKHSYLACCIAASIVSSPLYADPSKDCSDDNNKRCKTALIKLDKTVVTATRTETDNAKFAGSIGVVEPEDLAVSANVVDGLSVIPGVETGGDNGRSIGSQYTIRGFGYQSEERVIIKQNGVPQSPSLFSNHISAFRTDTDILKRVEVVKGASSVLYGSGAIGGIIDMTTNRAEDYLNEGEAFGSLVGVRYESNKMHSVRAGMFGKSAAVPVDFVLYAKQAKNGDIDLADGGTEDYQTIGNDETINTTYFNIGFDITPEQRISLSVFDYDEDLETVWQTLYHYEIDQDSPIIGSLQQTDFVVDYAYDSSDNDLIDLSVKAYSNESFYDRGWDDLDVDTGERDKLQYKNEETRWGFNVKNVSRFATGNMNHSLLMGLEFNNREEDAVYIRNGAVSDFGSMPNSYDDWGFYIQDIIEAGQFEVTLGGRYDQFDRKVNLAGKTDYDDNNFSPRVAVAYEAAPGFNLLLGYSETFRAPTPHETSSEGALNPHYYYLPNPDLAAETAKEMEGGFSYNGESVFTDGDQISVKATYFNGKIDDMISLQRLTELGDPPESSFYAKYLNVENAKRKGYEITANYLISQWRIDSSFEHLELYDEETGENVNQAFADKLQLSTTYTIEDLGLQVGLNMDHWFKPDQNPKTIVSRGVTYTYVDQTFTQLNLRGSWDIPVENFSIAQAAMLKFGVNNLTDKKYINARYTNTTSRVGTGRNVYVDLELRF